jgi:hypothetical protein
MIILVYDYLYQNHIYFTDFERMKFISAFASCDFPIIIGSNIYSLANIINLDIRYTLATKYEIMKENLTQNKTLLEL